MNIDLPHFINIFMILAGFIIALGGVTVIDLCGFLGRKSGYWTLAAIRIHKYTRFLIWGGFLTIVIGKIWLYTRMPSEILPAETYILGVIGLNALFLFFVVSPYLIKREKEGKAEEPLPMDFQNKVMGSFIISFLMWWSEFALTVYSLIN